MVGGWPFFSQRRDVKALLREGVCELMMMDFTIAGFVLAVFCAGVAVGKIVEKVERYLRKKEDEEDKRTYKNDRR